MPTASRTTFGLQLAVIALLAALLPLSCGSYFVHVYTIGWYYAILALSWNLLAGFTGQFALATHAFASIGGYASALLVLHATVPMPLGVLAGTVLAGLIGY